MTTANKMVALSRREVGNMVWEARATFRARAPWVDHAEYVALESVELPGRFLVATKLGVLLQAPRDTGDWALAAAFRTIPPLA